MCNAYKHPSDCHCGFGPPYDEVQVEIRKLPSPADTNPKQLAELDVRFPVPRATYYSQISSTAKIEMMAAFQNSLQRLADDRFGKANFLIKVRDVRKGSLTFEVLLITGLVGAYKFFKDYEALRKGVKAFCQDIWRSGKWLKKSVYQSYRRIEARSQTQRKRSDHVKSSKPSRKAQRGRRQPPA